MMRRALLTLLVLILLGLGFTVWLARHSFAREPQEVPAPWSAKALEDDTLMLEKWLAARGFAVRRGGGPILQGELPPGGTLVLMTLSNALMEGEVDSLLAWVRGGGRLLVDCSAAPFNDRRGTRGLLDRLGVVLESTAKEEDSEQPFRIETVQSDAAAYHVRFNRMWRLRSDQEEQLPALADQSGAMLMLRREGRGQILLLADCSFLYNNAFAQQDHAAWLAKILGDAGADPAKGAVVWSRIQEMALLPWLWEKARPFLIACAVLLVAWLWAGMRRFGSVLPPASTTRRSLLEHLEASGRFLWHRGGRETLLATSRAAVMRRASRLHPAFPSLPEAERLAFLSRHSGLPEEAVASSLIDRPGLTAEEQALYLQILQSLRQRLTHIS